MIHYFNLIQGDFMTSCKSMVSAAGFSCLVFFAATMASDAAPSKVYSPHVEQGELEIEQRGIVNDDGDAAKDGGLKLKTGVGYGITDWWFAEAYVKHEREPGGSLKFTAVELESIFQLTQPGAYFVDLGFIVEYATSVRGGRDEVEFGPLIEKQIGPVVNTANLIISKETGHDAASYKFEYALASRWRLKPYFLPGIEAFGEAGEIRDFGAQRDEEHKIGPAVTGAIPLHMGPGKLRYEAAYLFGVTQATPDRAVRWLLEYEMRF